MLLLLLLLPHTAITHYSSHTSIHPRTEKDYKEPTTTTQATYTHTHTHAHALSDTTQLKNKSKSAEKARELEQIFI